MYTIDKISDTALTENFSKYSSQVGGDVGGEGGVFIITHDEEPCAVLISMAEYKDYKRRLNKEYLDKLEEAEEQIRRGEVVTLTLEQLKSL